MDKEVVIERLEMLISLISETEPENPNDRELFSHHAIKTQENVKWLRDIITGRETPQQDNYRERLIDIMKDSNRFWHIRNKIHNGEWDSLELLELQETIEEFIGKGHKIQAIKHYRQWMYDNLKEGVTLKEAKDMVDAVARGETVDLSKGHTIK